MRSQRVSGCACQATKTDFCLAALSYGIYKTDLPESDPIKVMFIDIGEASTSAAVVAFQKGQLKVLGTAYDANLGGRNFDDVLLAHFANEFKVSLSNEIWEVVMLFLLGKIQDRHIYQPESTH